MSETQLRRLDAVVSALLWIWAGMALGFGAFVAPRLFQFIPSRDLAGEIAGAVVRGLDWAAWAAFGAALLLGFGLRWLNEVRDKEPIGPLYLWTAAATVAVLMCFASSFVVSPRLQEIRAHAGSIESLAPDSALRRAYDKGHGLSRNFFFLRVLLAVGLAASAGSLPKTKAPDEKAE